MLYVCDNDSNEGSFIVYVENTNSLVFVNKASVRSPINLSS